MAKFHMLASMPWILLNLYQANMTAKEFLYSLSEMLGENRPSEKVNLSVVIQIRLA